MEKIIKEGKELESTLNELLEENNLTKDSIIYTTSSKKGGLFKGDQVVVTAYTKDSIHDEIKEYLKEIVSNLGLEVNFEVKTKDERTTIKMYSDNNPILIGKNGQTIKALETLVKQMLKSKYDLNYKVSLDVENYKEKRERHLIHNAKMIAKDVARTKVAASLDNMSSYDRMLIHNALTDFKGVKTESEGEEPNRHIVIKPV